jgi:hypothetical protein
MPLSIWLPFLAQQTFCSGANLAFGLVASIFNPNDLRQQILLRIGLVVLIFRIFLLLCLFGLQLEVHEFAEFFFELVWSLPEFCPLLPGGLFEQTNLRGTSFHFAIERPQAHSHLFVRPSAYGAAWRN